MSELDRIEEKGDISDRIYGDNLDEEFDEFDFRDRKLRDRSYFSERIVTMMSDRYSLELECVFINYFNKSSRVHERANI